MDHVPFGFEHRSLQASWRNAQVYVPALAGLFLLLLGQSIFYPDPTTHGIFEPYYRTIYIILLCHLGITWFVAKWVNKTGKVNLVLLRVIVGVALTGVSFLAILDNMGRQDVSAACVTLFLLPVVIHMRPRVFISLILPFILILFLGIISLHGEVASYLSTIIQISAYTVIAIMVQKSLFSNRLDRYLCQLEILEANARIARLASRDPVTGLYNQKHFDTLISAEWQRSKRHSHVFALIELDVDFPVGDEVLRHIGAYLQTLLRRSDHAARIGDAKFILLLVETEMDGARILADRLRIGIAQLPSAKDLGHSLTSSIGIATSSESPSAEDLLKLVKRRLGTAKNSGPGHIIAH